VFLFLGADPATDWLADCGVQLDGKGFVETGAAIRTDADARGDGNAPLPLETSVRGIFAIGDVRAGSVKRVGGAIGEGAAVVAQIHGFLAERAEQPARAAD
jgi:thioredoxin reductase (NADPH)